MNRFPLFLLLCFVSVAGIAQNRDYTARIVDADTGEPLPCVGIFVSRENTTLTNFDGEFRIKALPSDTLRMTCVGHKTLRLCANELPQVVEMQVNEGRMSEVTVMGMERLLSDIARETEKAYKKTKKSRSQYFYRQTTVVRERQDIVEAFVDARSTVNLRDLHFFSGRHGQTWETGQTKSSLFSNQNLHHVLELAPMIFDSEFWGMLTIPLCKGRSISQYRELYDIEVEEISHEGRELYKIVLHSVKKETPMMVGTLYVDKQEKRVLSFDGQLLNMTLDFHAGSAFRSGVSVGVNLDFKINYTHDGSSSEVANMSMQTSFDGYQTRTMVFNVSDMPYMQGHKGIATKENMLETIDVAGYDSTFWANHEIIKRTKEEQEIAQAVINREREEVGIHVEADTPSPLGRLADRARLFGERIPQEKVYVHMDNTGYFLGDTIWFAAYTRRTDTGRPSRVSRVLYAELWNHDGYLVERKLVEMREGRGHGFFALPDTLYSGYFELRAYTRWQLNWGQTEHPHNKNTELWFYNKEMAKDYFRDYEKLYSRVFPVYDKPKQEGEYTRDMTLRPLRRYFRKDEKKPGLVLSLFPEGGNLVAGVPCRVAFEAAREDGEAMQGRVALQMKNEKVKIKNERDEEVTEVRTEHRGRGAFTFTPEAGCTYEAVFVSDDGETTKTKLKDIAREGVALQVTQEDSVWNFRIHSSLGKPLGLTVMHEGVTSHFVEMGPNLNENKNEDVFSSHFSLLTSSLPTGVNQATVFDEEGRVWADRLFFVMRPEVTKPTLAVTGLKEQYEPYEQVNLTIRPPSPTLPLNGEGASISLSVRDAALQDYTFDSGNIMTEMLLSSEIKGFVPQPEWYFESDDEEHRRGLDLLLMTQGWRRFAWHDMAVTGAWELTHPAEQSQTVTGSVNKYSADPYIYLVRSYLESVNMHWLQKTNGSTLMTELEAERAGRNLPKDEKKDYRAFSDAQNIVGQKMFDSMVQAQKTFGTGSNPVNNRLSEYSQQHDGDLKHEVCVHAEIVKPDAPKGKESGIVGEMTTENKGRFKLELPRFYGDCVFFLAARDTSLWDSKRKKLWLKKFRNKNWIQMEDDEYERLHEDAEFYVRLNFPYPRWIKPYSYYQTHLTVPPMGRTNGRLLTDSTHLLNEVTIRARRNGLRRIDLSKPVLVKDAYEAGNEAIDAGLLSNLYISTLAKKDPKDSSFTVFNDIGYGGTSEMAEAIIKNYVGDMDMYRHYETALFWDSIRVAGAGVMTSVFINPETERAYSRLEYLDKIYLYTDYSPRNEGSERYRQDDQPSVEVSLHKLPENERRVTYRDRRYILHGFAYQEDFYHPDYSRQHPTEPTDHRRTLYWNPNLTLDENGHATISFWNNSRHNQLSVSAEGITKNGGLLTGQ